MSIIGCLYKGRRKLRTIELPSHVSEKGIISHSCIMPAYGRRNRWTFVEKNPDEQNFTAEFCQKN
jgi:hypothetical protein